MFAKAIKSIFTFNGLLCCYVLSIFTWFFVWTLFDEPHWTMTVLNRFAPFLFVPIPILLGACILMRKWRSIAPLTLPAALFVIIYSPYLIPGGSWPDDVGAPIKVMTFNVLNANSDIEAVARTVKRQEPDVLLLQEVTDAAKPKLVKVLAEQYPHRHFGTQVPGGTTAIFSKFPKIDVSEVPVPNARPILFMTVRVQNQDVIFASSHFPAYFNGKTPSLTEIPGTVVEKTQAQRNYADRLVFEVLRMQRPVIVGCDANSRETNKTYRILTRAMKNAARETGWVYSDSPPLGTKQDTLLTHIDYLFYRGPNLVPKNVYRVRDSGGSDHAPVLGLFYLKIPKGADVAAR